MASNEAISAYDPKKFTFLGDDANKRMHMNKRKVKRYIFEGEDNTAAIEAFKRE